MTESSYPNPGVTQLQHERLMGRSQPSGLLGVPTDPPLVYADGVGTREVRIRASRQAIVEGYGWQNDTSVVTKTLAANSSGSTRVDLVVLRLDRTTWTVTSQVIQGSPGSGAPSPITNSPGGSPDYYDLPLATVTVANGATTLASGTVTPVAWYLNPDGQILCTASTRPPHSPGRRIWQTDASRQLVSTGTAPWLVVAEDAAVSSLPLASGWGASVNVLHRFNGQVFLALSVVRNGTGIADGVTVTVGTLPAGFRPRAVFEGLAHAQSSGPGRFVVNVNGTVQLTMYGGLATSRYANLHPVTFPAA